MVFGILIATVLGAQAEPVNISFRQGMFTVTAPSWVEKVRVKEPDAKMPTFEFADGDLSVRFDGYECTVRLGAYKRSTRFKDIPTAPRLFSKEQIRGHLALIEQGKLTAEVSALSGFELIGNLLYMLWRWDSTAPGEGFEALVTIDISAERPWFTVVDRLPGKSRATGPVSDELFLAGRKLAAVAETQSRWGLGTWDLDQSFMQFVPLGSRLARYSVPKATANDLLFVDRADNGNWVAGRIVLRDLSRTNIAESLVKVSFVASQPAVVRFDSEEETRLRYVDSGKEKSFPAWTAARFTPRGILVWYPAAEPVSAEFYDLGTWDAIGTWAK